ncbi:hypothetical protein V865_002775 [Kwoniella europaea PYCC6329]|uniref:Inner centromere protein ARK-binding domain-containing protein n=1 Tax=Kwoniella europaea PYCC6329 TaxID=1423913 RepID=A0AAX4KF75_9TREE
MSTIYGTQLEPFEENQSPSPHETTDNPYETTLAIRSSSLPKRRGSGPPSPVNTVNTLHRQLSGDPESPPPAWKRRPTVSNRQSRSLSSPGSPRPVNGDSISTGTQRSPSQSSVKSRNSVGYRRPPPPGLTMTTSSPKPAVPLPNGMFLHESPNSSSTNLASGDVDLALPNPAFRRRGNGNGSISNRSSIASNQDLGSLTSEELWAMGQEQDSNSIPDMSNPMRQAAERPLDTVRRESRRIEKDRIFTSGLPGDVIWPAAPPIEEILPDARSKSFTNVATLGMSGRRMSRRTKSRQSSIDVTTLNGKDADGLYMHNASQPASPVANGMGVLSSAHSSSTSLASQALPPNKSFSSLGGRPPSTYYSRDFLSSLAPREGGYAIAAQMGGGLGAVGSMSVEEKRRSSMIIDDGRAKTLGMGSRAPPSKSAGMGRWSLDGGENFGRPYGTASAATTSSNLSAPPINSAEPSPPAEEITPSLPAGASPAYTSSSAPSIPVSKTPPNPSPLAQQTSAEAVPKPAPAVSAPPPIPASTVAPPPALATKKSKKQLAKENKAAEKAAAMQVARQRAEAARAEALKKQAEREEAKRKEKEEKARKKAEKKAAKKGKKFLGISGTGSTTSATSGSSTPHPQSQPQPSTRPVPERVQSKTPIAVQHPSPTPTHPANSTPTSGTPFPKPIQSSQSAYKVPVRVTKEAPRQTHKSMPLNVAAPPPAQTPASGASSARPPIEGKRSLFGTIRKRFSYIAGSDSKVPGSQARDTAPPVPPVPRTPTTATGITTSPPVASSSQVNGHTSPPPTAESSSLPPRRESLLASESIAKVASPIPIDQPQPQPPVQPQPQTPVLDKTHSRELATSSPPPSAGTRKRNSLHGPRPMPTANGGSPRPSSVSTHESANAIPTGLQAGQITPTPSSTTNDSSSFFLQSHNSHMTNITPITSPEDNDNDTFDRDLEAGDEVQVEPKKSGSADSNETVHVGNVLPSTSTSQPILA